MDQAPDDKIAALLETLWQKNLPVLLQRLDLLDRIAADASTGSLSDEDRLEALGVAHKLSGSLGMFGYGEGTLIARQMERTLKDPTADGLRSLRKLAGDLRTEISRTPTLIPQSVTPDAAS